jgi:RNA polymerase sigma-70 factor, ECF subfamily
MSEIDETTLARGLRDADPDAIRLVVARYSPSLRTISRALLADHQAADDAVQQTFVRAWRAADRVDPARSLGGWLGTICRRVCIDVYRRNRRAAGAVTVTGEVEAGADRADLTSGAVETDAVGTTVRRAIDRLPAGEQTVVRHAYFDGWSYPEIADRLDLPLGTVKSRAHRAHRRLARTLAPLASVA